MAAASAAKKIGMVLAFAGLLAFFYLSGLGKFLTLATLKANREALALYHTEHRLLMTGSFLAVYILQAALSLPGAALMSLAAGAIFGALEGTCYSVVGATVGASLSFLFTRYLLNDFVQRRFGGRLQGINRELEQRGLNYLLFLRLVPVFPFFLINLAAAVTKLPFKTFLTGTAIGIIPGGFVFCNAGASLISINSMSEVASPRVLGSFALLGGFALIPVLYSKFRGREK
jgi:uncharacterized membrane protein YdjX (TVP38/TMEM64 family)